MTMSSNGTRETMNTHYQQAVNNNQEYPKVIISKKINDVPIRRVGHLGHHNCDRNIIMATMN